MKNILLRCCYAWGIALMIVGFIKYNGTDLFIPTSWGGLLIGLGSGGWEDNDA